jgi:hypothetical protein
MIFPIDFGLDNASDTVRICMHYGMHASKMRSETWMRDSQVNEPMAARERSFAMQSKPLERVKH